MNLGDTIQPSPSTSIVPSGVRREDKGEQTLPCTGLARSREGDQQVGEGPESGKRTPLLQHEGSISSS